MPTLAGNTKPAAATIPIDLTAEDYQELLAPLRGPDDARPPTDEQGRLVPTERDESKADFIPGVETLGRDSLRKLRKAIYDVVATVGAHINDAPDQWWEVHDSLLFGALDPITRKRNGKGICKEYKDWKPGNPDRRGNKTRTVCLSSMKKDDEKHRANKALQGVRIVNMPEDPTEYVEIDSEDELSVDGTASTVQMGSRMLREFNAAVKERNQSGARGKSKTQTQIENEAIEDSLGLTSPGRGCQLPPGMPFPPNDPHIRGVRLLSLNTSSKLCEYFVCECISS